MKDRTLFAFILCVVFVLVCSGCKTADTAVGDAAHRAALHALASRSCKIVLEEVYIPSDRPENPRVRQLSGSYLLIKGDKLQTYLLREEEGLRLFFYDTPLNHGEADLQMDDPRVRKNGDTDIRLRILGDQPHLAFEWAMTLYRNSDRCFVRSGKIYSGGNFGFKGRIVPLSGGAALTE